MVRKCILIIFLVCFAQIMMGQNTLNIRTSDGEIYSVPFSAKPVVTFSVDDVVRVATQNSDKSFNSRDINLISFENAPMVVLGDVNGDGKVNITDAVGIVNYLLGNPSDRFIESAADVNNDGNITITDAVAVVNMILNQGNQVRNMQILDLDPE